jgi:choline-phosphate cytidylyltransferase
MVKVITYGTYDLLHYGHIRLLERAKSLGDYLIVGVTSDDYDKTRGKINNQQSLMERVAAVKATGLADEIIVEEYDGQKIDDIKRLGVDIFTVGSDWEGKFDYLQEYCKVVYLQRTEGISSSSLRTERRKIRLSIVGNQEYSSKFKYECDFVNGVTVVPYDEGSKEIDALYIIAHPEERYDLVKEGLSAGKHILCESPIALDEKQCEELFEIADRQSLVLMEGIKTAYSTAFTRLIVAVKSGKIGRILSIDSTCTSMREGLGDKDTCLAEKQNSIYDWGPIALLPVFQLLGTDYISKRITSQLLDKNLMIDGFSKIDFTYKNAVASIKVAKAAKSEGELVITGTNAYVYVPAPWWKTDYYEIRYENPEDNKRFFYQLDGEGIRYEIVAFLNQINRGYSSGNISRSTTAGISRIMHSFRSREDLFEI